MKRKKKTSASQRAPALVSVASVASDTKRTKSHITPETSNQDERARQKKPIKIQSKHFEMN